MMVFCSKVVIDVLNTSSTHKQLLLCRRHTVNETSKDSLFLKNIPTSILCSLHKETFYIGAKEWSKDLHIVKEIECLRVPESNCYNSRRTAAKMKTRRDALCWKWAIQAEHTRYTQGIIITYHNTSLFVFLESCDACGQWLPVLPLSVFLPFLFNFPSFGKTEKSWMIYLFLQFWLS